MSLATLSRPNKQIDDLFEANDEIINIFGQNEAIVHDSIDAYYFSNWKQEIKVSDNLIQSDDFHNSLNILQQEMGFLICDPEHAQDLGAICKKGDGTGFEGLEKQQHHYIGADDKSEIFDISGNSKINLENVNSSIHENPMKNIKLKAPMVDFDFKFEEKHIGSTINTSIKDFHSKSVCGDKQIEDKNKDFTDEQSYDESQSSEFNIKTETSKSKLDSNLFLIRRAGFRGFSEYYKNLFAKANYSWQRKRGNKKKKTPMMTLIRDFAENEFGDLVTKLTEPQWVNFRTTLFTILFSHRYKKNDEFLREIDFTKVRSVLYHYTTEARNEFLKNSQFGYLIHHFYKKNRVQFLKSKQDDNRKLSIKELETELSIMHEEALKTLQKQSPFNM